MTFTAEPNIGSHLVEATPPNLLEHIDEHIKFLRECKITFTGSIGRGDIPYTKSAMTLLNNIDVLIAGEEADKEVLRFNSGDMMGMIPPATKHYRPDLDLRTLESHGRRIHRSDDQFRQADVGRLAHLIPERPAVEQIRTTTGGHAG